MAGRSAPKIAGGNAVEAIGPAGGLAFPTRVCHPIGVSATDGVRGAPGSALAALADTVDDTELRPALTRSYARDTLDCYGRRLRHYQAWCQDRGYQSGADRIDTDKIEEYVVDQVTARELRPSTLRQAVNALMYHGERHGVRGMDDRAAKELVRRYEAAWRADGIPPAHRVVGRRSPRPRRS
jgi:hypothetical protein